MTIPRPESKPPKRKLPAPLYGIQKKIRTRGMDPEAIAWDDYLIPGMAEDVLRNKVGLKSEPYGCTDRDLLKEREERFTAFRMVELKKKPIVGNFDYEHMASIHKHLFQDVYEWAGEPRTVFLSKGGYDYGEAHHIQMFWNEQHKTLMADNMLQGITNQDEFAEQLAFHWGMVNFAHAFREGNTRSQVVFFHQLAEQAGWDLDVAMLGPDHPESIRDEFIEARFHHQGNGFDTKPLAQVLSKALTRREPELEHGIARESGVERDLVEQAVNHMKNPPFQEIELNLDDRFRKFPELAPEPAPRHRLGPEQGGPEL